jgi:hypothetical protein
VPAAALTWTEFAAKSPALADAGRRLLYQFGPVALAFLATTRADGGPRAHPVCPALHEGGLFVFVIGHSPKRFDLARDGRFALHAFPGVDDDESFYCTGRAREVSVSAFRARAEASFAHHVKPEEALFELRVSAVLHTTWVNPRTPATHPLYARWKASDSA